MDPVARRPDADGIKLRNQIKELVDRCLTRFCTGSQEDRSATANTLLFFNNFGRDICAHVITILRERALIHNNEDVCLGYDAAMPHIETNNTSLGRLGLTIEMVFEDFMRMYKRSRDQHTRPGGDKFPLHLADSVSVYRPKEAKFYFASQIWPDKGTEATSSPVEITGATKFTDPNERAKYERYIASAKPFDQEKLSYSRRKLVRTGTFLPYWAPRKCGNCSKALQEDEELMETRCKHWYCVDCSTICMMRSVDCNMCALKKNPKWWNFACASSENHSQSKSVQLELEGGDLSEMFDCRLGLGRPSSRL